EADQLRFRGERDADLEVALLAVREIYRELVLLAREADVGEDRARAVDDVPVRAMVTQHAPVVAAGLAGDPDIFQDGGARQEVGDLVGARDGLAGDGV